MNAQLNLSIDKDTPPSVLRALSALFEAMAAPVAAGTDMPTVQMEPSDTFVKIPEGPVRDLGLGPVRIVGGPEPKRDANGVPTGRMWKETDTPAADALDAWALKETTILSTQQAADLMVHNPGPHDMWVDDRTCVVSPPPAFPQAVSAMAHAQAVFGSAPSPQASIPAPSSAGAGQPPSAPTVPSSTVPNAPAIPAPPPASEADVPQVPAAPGSPVLGVELDSAGLPWDGRIHSGGKTKINDGSWRKRAGVDPTIYETVLAELRATMGAPAPTVASVPPPPAAPDPFVELTTRLAKALTPPNASMTLAQATEVAKSLGLPDVPALKQRPDLIPAFYAKLPI